MERKSSATLHVTDADVLRALAFNRMAIGDMAVYLNVDAKSLSRPLKRLKEAGTILATGNRRSVVYSLPVQPAPANGEKTEKGTRFPVESVTG